MSQESLKFSIIVPVYNVERYLRKCLDSLLRQGLKNYEIILINDGSTDDSEAICKEYVDNNSCFKLINQTNQGVCVARNNGIKHAKGDWIVLVDSDDYLLDNGLCTAFSAVDNKQCYDVIQYKSSYDFWPKQTLTLDVTFKGSGHELIKRSGFVSFCWLCFYRREFLLKHSIQFNSNYIAGEDQLFVVNVYLHNPRIVLVSTDIYRYVVHEDSVTTKRDVHHTRRCVKDYLSSYSDILSLAQKLSGNDKEVIEACRKALNSKKMFGFSRILSSRYDYKNFIKVRKFAQEIGFYPILANSEGMKFRMMSYIMNLIIQHYFVYKLASFFFNSIIVYYILPRLRKKLRNGK